MAAVLVALTIAAAATLGGVTARKLGAGSAAVTSCDTDGFSLSYAASGTVTAVTVSGIADPGCESATLSLTLADSAGTTIGSGGPQTIPTDGDSVANSMSVSVSPQPAASQVARVHVVVTGP